MKISTVTLIAFSFAASVSVRAQMMDTNFLNFIFPKNPISMKKNNDPCFVRAQKMLPRGSALITQSGDMNEGGITAVIHAATGAMTRSGGEFEPNPESIRNSIRNSLILAKRFKHKKVAIPFLGGGIFAARMGVSKEELADIIVKASLDYKKKLAVVFVLFTSSEEKIFTESLEKISKDPEYVAKLANASVVKGSITEFSVHKSSAIVNAANMEVVFGGGISGAIGSATGISNEIDSQAGEFIRNAGMNCFSEDEEDSHEINEVVDVEN